MTRFQPDFGKHYDLPAHDSWPATKHRFDRESCWAIRAALQAGRPLLLRGEPGIGKSQLARAAAAALKVPFLYHVIDERTERDDLLYSYDAISRLAEAQVCALIAKEEKVDWRRRLAERNFIRPGVLWWAFNWRSAKQQADRFADATDRACPPPFQLQDCAPPWQWPCGPVVLVDEIDKADPSVPNGLLESLGNEGFRTALLGEAIRLPDDGAPPLVMVTTNEERELPAAFLRRCLVYRMRFPREENEALEFLLHRARVHFAEELISNRVIKSIVTELRRDRAKAESEGLAKPGAAEFLDLVKILAGLHPGDETKQTAALVDTKEFALQKNLDEPL